MKGFDVVLWDVDGTLLDFSAAERAAMISLFRDFDMGECDEEMLSRYSEINKKYWRMLELGEMTKPQILKGRFEEFFMKEGIDYAPCPEEFNRLYQLRMGDTIVFCDNSREIVSSLRGRVKQYAASNGTVTAQTKKLSRSGFDALLDGVFLSEDLGYEKPAVQFFDLIFRAIGPVDKNRVIMIGDSLTGDIAGGNRSGIKTCWYNPAGLINETEAAPDYEIGDLHEVMPILEGSL